MERSWFLHRADRRKHGFFTFCPVLACARFRLQLLGASLHRGFFFGCKSFTRLLGDFFVSVFGLM